jgi:radical SAM/Cys-rich protein
MCNQTCRHCHVDAGPDRKEIMTKETMQQCIEVLKNNPQLKTVDLTGGAPEMNPNFKWFVEEIKKLDKHVIVRCNLTIILANKRYHDLPAFYKLHNIEVVSSLPFYTQDRTDRQRGSGVFEDSIKALQMLNEVGYGKENTGIILNLVYNPAGAFLPPSQVSLEAEYKKALMKEYGIVFNNLFAITNLPISRFLDYLLTSGNYESYMEKLVNAYNPVAAANVMCRNTISIGWDGYLYDCDFNQMLELKVNCNSRHISEFNNAELNNRNIVIGQHCYGCTAGSGSSCGGAVT